MLVHDMLFGCLCQIVAAMISVNFLATFDPAWYEDGTLQNNKREVIDLNFVLLSVLSAWRESGSCHGRLIKCR